MKMMEPRLTLATMKVLRMFVRNPTYQYAGSEISREADVWSGTLYPMLARLETAGWLSSHWEDVDPRVAGRPRKRFYELTSRGRQKALGAFAELELSRSSSRSRGQREWVST